MPAQNQPNSATLSDAGITKKAKMMLRLTKLGAQALQAAPAAAAAAAASNSPALSALAKEAAAISAIETSVRATTMRNELIAVVDVKATTRDKELLTQALLRLDAVEANGVAEVRAARKKLSSNSLGVHGALSGRGRPPIRLNAFAGLFRVTQRPL